MNILLHGVNQFTQRSIDQMHTEIATVRGTALGPTVSLCNQCHYHIPA